MVPLTVDGKSAGHVHRSVLDRVAEIAGRLRCEGAVTLGSPPASFDGPGLARLRRDLELIVAFADAARCTGWVLGDIAVAPGEKPVPMLDTPQGRLWVHPVRGVELHAATGARQVTERVRLDSTARRTALHRLIAPLLKAAASGALEVHETEQRDAQPPES